MHIWDREKIVGRSNVLLTVVTFGVLDVVLCAAAVCHAAEPQKVRVEIRKVYATGSVEATMRFLNATHNLPALDLDTAIAGAAAKSGVDSVKTVCSKVVDVDEEASAAMTLEDETEKEMKFITLTVGKRRDFVSNNGGVLQHDSGRIVELRTRTKMGSGEQAAEFAHTSQWRCYENTPVFLTGLHQDCYEKLSDGSTIPLIGAWSTIMQVTSMPHDMKEGER
jgi:hypothetical protein